MCVFYTTHIYQAIIDFKIYSILFIYGYLFITTLTRINKVIPTAIIADILYFVLSLGLRLLTSFDTSSGVDLCLPDLVSLIFSAQSIARFLNLIFYSRNPDQN
jgi:hypothetical protein